MVIMVPPLILQFVPGTQARMHWGRSRLPVCNALVARARRLMDENGILRKPSLTGLQAMVLFHQLQHMSNDNTKAAETWMESESAPTKSFEKRWG